MAVERTHLRVTKRAGETLEEIIELTEDIENREVTKVAIMDEILNRELARLKKIKSKK